MANYISREAAIDDLDEWYDVFRSVAERKLIQRAIHSIKRIPAADVRPVVRAHWTSMPYKRARVCSHCECDEPYKFADYEANVFNFCPHCGADMREPQKEENE